MPEEDKKQQFITLRAKGLSLRKIADRLSVSRSTLFRWSKELNVEVSNQRAVEFEALCEEYLVCRQHRVKVLATQLHEVMQEILNRDLTAIPTWRLYQIQARLGRELKGETEDVILTSEKPIDPLESLAESLRKKEKWNA